MQLDEFSRGYLRLTLEIEKHIDGYVDAYLGPADLKADIENGEKKAAANLLNDLQQLRDKLPEDDAQRRQYLEGQLAALDCTLHILNGEEFDYLDEVERLYDIQAAAVDEAHFTAAHQELNHLVPGSGPLPQRLDSRRKKYELQPEQLMPLLELARVETRRRTAELLDLPADEGIELKLVNNQPWSAYNWFLGDGRSLIEFNTDVPVSALAILDIFAHEGYPGHHTEGILKEKLLYQQQGYGEQGAALLHSPAAVISEAIATTAVETIFPDGSAYNWIVDVLLPAAGLPGESADALRRVGKALQQLRYVSGNAAIAYHSGRLNKEQTIDYIITYALSTPERAAKSFQFLSHPLFRAYLFTYTWGYDLIEEAAQSGAGSKADIVRHLLHEQILPSQLPTVNNSQLTINH